MVKVTIYIEGGTNSSNSAADTVDNTNVFRESFHKLFSQKLSSDSFDLSIQPFGSVHRANLQLESIIKQHINGVILIDLDGPKSKKQERLMSNYDAQDTARIFFMIQEMEAWILSQPNKIEECLVKGGCIRKKQDEDISNNILLKSKHPEDIEAPSEKLKTILTQYFDIKKNRRGGIIASPKRYSKTKDGPNLIGYLVLDDLMNTFDEADALISYFTST